MKTKIVYICQNCGARSPRWVGRCPGCNSWNTFVEESDTFNSQNNRIQTLDNSDGPVLLTDVCVEQDRRYLTGVNEFDSVLGGGIVVGAVTLIGGEPGIGKSTLSMQIACALASKKKKILYVSGEESVKQTKIRAERLFNLNGNSGTVSWKDYLYIVNQVDVNIIREYIKKLSPHIVIVDSIQVIYSTDMPSAPGSVGQVRECSSFLTQMAKSRGISLFIIGHVTKEGTLAGPKVLEHIVDSVLYFEGERYSSYRILRVTKNRFGSTNEIGVFEMTATGLVEVPNPSQIFLAERPKDASGSVVVPVMEGSRPLLVEIQGLVSRANFGMARQKAQGFDANRMALLIAVLEKRIRLNLQDKDIFLNVVGGVRIVDPAADLGVVIAIASAFLDRPIDFDTVVLGEVGLSSEVRSVSQIYSRVKEAAKLGFKRCIIPRNNLNNNNMLDGKMIDIIPVDTVTQAMDFLQQ